MNPISPARPERRRRLVAAAALAATGLVVSACGSSASSSADGNTDAKASAGFPVTVQHALGSTTIPSAPQRVATVGWGSEDVAVALGDAPVAMPRASFGGDAQGFLPWTLAALKKAGDALPALHPETDGIPYEKVAESQPDVILGANSGLDKQQYDTLSKIAPTVAYPHTPWGTGWRDSTMLVGKALGKEAEAKQLVANTEKTIADTMAAYPQVKGKTAMVMWVDAKDPGKVSYYTPTDSRVQYLADLGFTIAPSIVKLSKGNKQFVGDIAAEKADELDAQVAVVYVAGGDLSTLQKDPLLSKIPAIARGSVVMLDNDTETMAVSAPTVLSIPWALPGYAKRLGAAASKV